MPSHLKSFYASIVFSFREIMKNFMELYTICDNECDMQTLKDMEMSRCSHSGNIQKSSNFATQNSIFADPFHIIWSPWFSLVRWGWRCEDKGWWGGGAPSAILTYPVWGGGWGGRSYKYHPHFGLYPSFGYLPFEDTSDNPLRMGESVSSALLMTP